MSGKEPTMSVQRNIPSKKVPAGKGGNVSRGGASGGQFAKLLADDSSAHVVIRKASLEKFARRHPDLGRSLAELAAEGKVSGVRSDKISARVDPGILAAAAERLGFAEGEVSDVVNASLALAAAPDRFKEWLRSGGDQIPGDFELAI
jgi:hypothetical protein